jgi:decaprenylphospho-beta-D-ribofuranose 2-oxidase
LKTIWVINRGWGNNLFSFSKQTSNLSDNNYNELLRRGVVPIGNGRSYGDSALNSGGYLLSSNNYNQIIINEAANTALVGSGVMLEKLEQELLKHNLFLPVVPGTAQITIGGAIASDVHGKSHHHNGSFGDHLLKIKLLTSTFEELELFPTGEYANFFWATVGGMGLTGQILEAEIRLIKVENELISVEEQRFTNISQAIDLFNNFNKKFLYTVAWLDISGGSTGRGIISGGNHTAIAEYKKKKSEFSKSIKKLFLPKTLYFNFVSNLFIKIFNIIWYYKPKKRGLVEIRKFMHPLDAIPNWNIVYGRKGFIQYQFVIPTEQADSLQEILLILKTNKVFSFLCVLKKFGRHSNGFLSFPIEGWTMTIDISRKHPNLSRVIALLDERIIELGGRVYLAKDSFLTRKDLESMYKKLDLWIEIKKKMDPDAIWKSDQGRRLDIC